MKFETGDVIKLTKETKKSHTCPIDRKNNRTAIIASVFEDRIRVTDDLAGCLWWNEEDVVIVRKAGEKKCLPTN